MRAGEAIAVPERQVAPPRATPQQEADTAYRPAEVARRLGIAPATLRLWSTAFAHWLSPDAQRIGAARLPGAAASDALGANREGAQRRYGDRDVRLLERVKTLLDGGLTYAQVEDRLRAAQSGDTAPNGASTDDLPSRPQREEGSAQDGEGMEAFRERLAAQPALPRKQRRLAQALFEQPETFAFGSVREVASEFGVNTVTVIRFAQSLGFAGYGALQAAVRQAYLRRAGLQAPRDPAAARAGSDLALDSMLAQHQTNLQLTIQHLRGDGQAALAAAADALLHARRILVCASGSGSVVALLLVRLLRHVGLRGELLAASGADRSIALHDVGQSDVVVGVNLWLTFQDVVDTLALARMRGATTLVFASSDASPAAVYADHLLLAPAQGAALRFSVLAPIAAVEALIAYLAGQRPDTVAAIEQALHDQYLQEGLLAPLLSAQKRQRSTRKVT